MGKEVITEADVVAAAESGRTTIETPLDAFIVTPGARDKALSLGIELKDTSPENDSSPSVSNALNATQAEDVVGQVTQLIRDRLPADQAPENLDELVRKVTKAQMNVSKAPLKHNSDQTVDQVGGVCFIKGNMIAGELNSAIPVAEKVWVADAFRCSEDGTLAGGYMEWSKASFNRTMENDEINIVILGVLHLTVAGQTSVVEPGDMVYIPLGTEVTYSTPEKVKLACVNSIRK